MRRLRSKAEKGLLGRSQTNQTKQEITQAGAFLTWLADRGRTIEHCQQADLDAWHTEKLATRRPAQTFLRWCMKTSRMSRLTLPPQVINQDQAPLHQHRRLAILRRALNDDSLPLRARVAAALVLLYAQPVTRIVRLTVDDVLDDGATVAVRLGGVSKVDLGREMILGCGAWRSDGRAVGGAGAAAAEGQETWPAADMDPAAADRRHTVADPDRDAVAGYPG